MARFDVACGSGRRSLRRGLLVTAARRADYGASRCAQTDNGRGERVACRGGFGVARGCQTRCFSGCVARAVAVRNRGGFDRAVAERCCGCSGRTRTGQSQGRLPGHRRLPDELVA